MLKYLKQRNKLDGLDKAIDSLAYIDANDLQNEQLMSQADELIAEGNGDEMVRNGNVKRARLARAALSF